MKPLLFITCILFSTVSCKTTTKPDVPAETKSVDTLALPKDSLAFYFPANSFSGELSLDSFIQNWYASALYSFKEPVLSQKFVGHNIYRFLWLRSFHRPVVFSLHHNQDLVWLTTKILDKQPQFYEESIGGIQLKDRTDYIKEGYVVDTLEPDLLVRKADRRATIAYSKTVFLKYKDWENFENVLAQANFWNVPATADQSGADGSQWIIEAHLNNKYRFADRWSPGGKFRKIGLHLINLSGLKEEIY